MIGKDLSHRSQKFAAIPAKAGIQVWCFTNTYKFDSRAVTKMRGNDAEVRI